MGEQEFQTEYLEYLSRAAHQMGVQVGGYAKVKGRLIKMLAYEEFADLWTEYVEVLDAYRSSMERGDTINDAVVELLRERSVELLLEFKL
jgi:hypothetical protein